MKLFDLTGLKRVLKGPEPTFQPMLETMTHETASFIAAFADDPSRISEWGHHYFCKADGGVLHYNPSEPHRHVCTICGTVYESKLLDGCWVSFYRNQVALHVWKAAVLYRLTKQQNYRDFIAKMITFYFGRYSEFPLHNKEGEQFSSFETAKWGCGKIMPQGLNEAIFLIRFCFALEIVKDTLSTSEWEAIRFVANQAFQMLQPQVDKIHNIPVWYNSAIAVMGMLVENNDMVEFAMNGSYGLTEQLLQGVTPDGFWFEGSIHYHFFTVEAILQTFVFAKIHQFPLSSLFRRHVKKMLKSAYDYAFSNLSLPNPNDGWPNINLKTYGYLYEMAVYCYGEQSELATLARAILNAPIPRTDLPLTKPYYFNQQISLERLTLIPTFDLFGGTKPEQKSQNYRESQFAILRNPKVNVFYKYGHNGPSHAHPDKMSIEVVLGDHYLTRDLSNAGYGADLCNEWHRVSASHTTVVVNGTNQISMRRGQTVHYRPDYLRAVATDVYRDPGLNIASMQGRTNHDEVVRYLMRYLAVSKEEAESLTKDPSQIEERIEAKLSTLPVIDYDRAIKLHDDGFDDRFKVKSDRDVTIDYFFHCEAKLLSIPKTEPADLGYHAFGYQHLSDIRKVKHRYRKIAFQWRLGDQLVTSIIHLDKNSSLYWMKTLDNPVNRVRETLMIRTIGANADFHTEWHISKEA
jgi:oligo-alginate lyase